MNNLKGLSEAHKLVLAEIDEARRQGYAEGFEAGKKFVEVETAEVKSANQQRAELIEKAKKFVEELVAIYPCFTIEFFRKNNRITCVIKIADSGKVCFVGRANCIPGGVFNERIGEAISLAKALKIDIPVEFLQAVQPSEVVVGMNVISYQNNDGVIHMQGEIISVRKGGFSFSEVEYRKQIGCSANWTSGCYGFKITDDTNAQYEVTPCRN